MISLVIYNLEVHPYFLKMVSLSWKIYLFLDCSHLLGTSPPRASLAWKFICLSTMYGESVVKSALSTGVQDPDQMSKSRILLGWCRYVPLVGGITFFSNIFHIFSSFLSLTSRGKKYKHKVQTNWTHLTYDYECLFKYNKHIIS